MIKGIFKWQVKWISEHRRFLRWSITFIALALAVRMLIAHSKDLSRLLLFQPWQVVAIFVLFFAMFFASTIPFLVIIKRLHGSSVSLWRWIKIMSVSRMANLIAPQSGTVYRAMILKRETGLTYTRYVYVFALFGWLTTLLDLLLVTGIILAFMPELSLGGFPAGGVTAVAFVLMLIGPLITEKMLDAFEPESGWPARVHGALHGMLQAMVEHGRNLNLIGMVVLFAVIKFVLWVLLNRLLFWGMDVQIGYAELVLFLAIYQISALVMISPGNLGVREVVFGLLGGAVGITPAQGVMVSALLRAVQYAVIFPLGLVFGGGRMLREAKAETKQKKAPEIEINKNVSGKDNS